MAVARWQRFLGAEEGLTLGDQGSLMRAGGGDGKRGRVRNWQNQQTGGGKETSRLLGAGSYYETLE